MASPTGSCRSVPPATGPHGDPSDGVSGGGQSARRFGASQPGALIAWTAINKPPRRDPRAPPRARSQTTDPRVTPAQDAEGPVPCVQRSEPTPANHHRSRPWRRFLIGPSTGKPSKRLFAKQKQRHGDTTPRASCAPNTAGRAGSETGQHHAREPAIEPLETPPTNPARDRPNHTKNGVLPGWAGKARTHATPEPRGHRAPISPTARFQGRLAATLRPINFPVITPPGPWPRISTTPYNGTTS
jgi:hypothetical protein